jgi:PPOX class probable F420-dependent enzyme
MNLDDMRSRVQGARVARLGTVGADRAPHLVPFCFVLTGDILYSAVDRKKKGSRRLRRLENISREPRVTVLVDHYEEDWTRLWWVSMSGRATELGPGAESDDAIRLLTSKYIQYVQMAPPGPVVRIQVERWSGWSAS